MSVAERAELITHLKTAAQAVDGYLTELREAVAAQAAAASPPTSPATDERREVRVDAGEHDAAVASPTRRPSHPGETEEATLARLFEDLLERWRNEVCEVTSDTGDVLIDTALRQKESDLAAVCAADAREPVGAVIRRAADLERCVADLKEKQRVEEEALLVELRGSYHTQKQRLGHHLEMIHETCKLKEEEDRLCRDAELIAQRRDEEDYKAILRERARHEEDEAALLLLAGPQTPEEVAAAERERAGAAAEDERKQEKRRLIQEAEQRRAMRKGYSTSGY